MRKLFGLLSPLLMIAFASSILTGAEQPTASVRGQAYADRLGLLFSDAKIEIYSNGNVIQSAITDKSGHYHLDNLAPGHYVITGFMPGANTRRIPVDLKPGDDVLVNIGLSVGPYETAPPPAFSITGTVRQINRTPIADAQIAVISPLDQQVIATAVTDSKGTYYVRVDYGEQLLVVASKPGFVAAVVNLYRKETANFQLSAVR